MNSGILYLIKINKCNGAFSGYYYKIGVTRNSVEFRYRSDLNYNYLSLFVREFPDYEIAYKLEQKYLDIFQEYLINIPIKIFENTKNTEVFIRDPFFGDYSMIPGKNLLV